MKGVEQLNKMGKYFVSIMCPLSVTVEADSPESAINVAFREYQEETASYGGDGIFVKDLITGETFVE